MGHGGVQPFYLGDDVVEGEYSGVISSQFAFENHRRGSDVAQRVPDLMGQSRRHLSESRQPLHKTLAFLVVLQTRSVPEHDGDASPDLLLIPDRANPSSNNPLPDLGVLQCDLELTGRVMRLQGILKEVDQKGVPAEHLLARALERETGVQLQQSLGGGV